MRSLSSLRANSSDLAEEKRRELNGAEQNITEKNRAQLNPNATEQNRIEHVRAEQNLPAVLNLPLSQSDRLSLSLRPVVHRCRHQSRVFLLDSP
jgi:hypothetical protein